MRPILSVASSLVVVAVPAVVADYSALVVIIHALKTFLTPRSERSCVRWSAARYAIRQPHEGRNMRRAFFNKNPHPSLPSIPLENTNIRSPAAPTVSCACPPARFPRLFYAPRHHIHLTVAAVPVPRRRRRSVRALALVGAPSTIPGSPTPATFGKNRRIQSLPLARCRYPSPAPFPVKPALDSGQLLRHQQCRAAGERVREVLMPFCPAPH